MGWVKRVEIWGFKKFAHLEVDFREKTNIIVGDNESGKSTVLEAINIVLNQWYKNTDKSIVKELLNQESISDYINAPSKEKLPSIRIEVVLYLERSDRFAPAYYGAIKRDTKTEAYGITFECKMDEETIRLLRDEINSGKLPYEYYTLSWTTFQGSSYNILKKPINSILIDTAATEAWSSFNYFNKTLFNSKYDDSVKNKARNDFRQRVDEVINDLSLEELDENRRFGINSRKLVLDNLLSVFDQGIALENRGKGVENIIKTRISLDKVKNKMSTIFIEEPESHLSFSTLLKMIKDIEERGNVCQTIITTHSNMIASRLSLKNVLWLNESIVQSLANVKDDVANYFMKVDNNNLLNMLLAHRVIIVEGASEYILLPKLYQKKFSKSIEEDRITIISCNGLAYENYLQIAEKVGKKVAVITDNDKNDERILHSTLYNDSNERQHIFMSSNHDEWTWEACIYKLNEAKLKKIINVNKSSNYNFNGTFYGRHLGKMLNNKVETAYMMLLEDYEWKIPKYVEEAFDWVRK